MPGGHVLELGERHLDSAGGRRGTSGAVLSRAAAAFEASGCELAQRLLLALEAGGSNGEGDSRCTTLLLVTRRRQA